MRLYFMSICGTGMGNAALLMRQLGHEVFGCDQNVYPPMSDRLEEAGIEILPGFNAGRLHRLAPDCVVVGNVNTRGNEEIEWLLETRRFPVVSMPQILSEALLRKRKNIVVTGTHGKTTTTAMIATLLQQSDAKSGYLIGGICKDFPDSSFAGNEGHPFVIEGDEYDSAFFDKRSKFIHYQPNILIINNLEFDHADIFRDLTDIKRTFNHAVKLIPRNGALLVNGDDADAMSVAATATWTQVYSVGINDSAIIQIRNFKQTEAGSSFSLYWKGKLWAELSLKHWGLFNVRNASMAAVATALALSPEDPTAFDPRGISQFKGVKRRQELLFEDKKVLFLTDFAHHPTAVKSTLEAMRLRFSECHIIACMEARSNTACRNIHQAEFTESLREADFVIFGEVYRSDRYADEDRINFPKMASSLGEHALVAPHNADIPKLLLEKIKSEKKSVVIFFSNGSFDQVPQKMVDLWKAI